MGKSGAFPSTRRSVQTVSLIQELGIKAKMLLKMKTKSFKLQNYQLLPEVIEW